MKKQNGVSMIELVIVLIVILLISTFSVYTGKEAVDQATATEVYTEINSIRSAINSINIKKELDESFTIVSGEHYDAKATDIKATKDEFEVEYGITVSDEEFDNLYIIYGMDELEKYKASNVKDKYGLDSIKHTYLVNFKECSVDLFKSIKISDRNVRTFEQVRALVDNGEI